MTQGVLLNAAADVVDDRRAQAHDMERVQNRDAVGQLVPDGVGVAPERVQRGVVDAGDELLGLLLQPAGVGGPGPARHDVQEPGVQVSVVVPGQVHHRGHRPVLGADPGRAPDVLVHTQHAHPGQPGGVRQASLGLGLDGVPAGVPVHSEVTGQGRDGGVIVLERIDGPGHRSGCQLGADREEVVLLAERGHRA